MEVTSGIHGRFMPSARKNHDVGLCALQHGQLPSQANFFVLRS